MTQEEKRPTGIINSATELRQLIIDNPELPLVVFAGEDANSGGEYSYMSCSHISASVGEFLDCMQTVNDCKCYTDREEFEEDLSDNQAGNENAPIDGTEAEWDAYIKALAAEYAPYWKKCIILYVDN